MTAVELAVTDLDGVRVALELGADRVEVCAALEVGGLTPSLAFVERTVALAAGSGLGVHPLIRVRAGGFVYADDEVAIMADDVRRLVDAGADGVVVGALRDGAVDLVALELLREAAGDAEVTFHRAVDAVDASDDVLGVLADAGVTRVLTAGGTDVSAGLDRLRALCAQPSRRVQVMAGGGVTEANVAALLEVGVDAVHFSAGARVEDPSAAAGGYGSHHVMDPARARRLVDLVRGT